MNYEEAETDEEVIVKPKDLYKKFEDMLSKDHISIGSFNNSISKGQASSMIKSTKDWNS